jgi:hypothetical protein
MTTNSFLNGVFVRSLTQAKNVPITNVAASPQRVVHRFNSNR